MRNLFIIILLLGALTTHAQNSRRATVQPDTLAYPAAPNLLNTPKLASDSLQYSSQFLRVESSREAARKKRRHAGTVCSIVGLSMMTGGAAISAVSNGGLGYGLLSVFLISSGTGVTIVGGAILLSSLDPHNERYSIVLHPNGLGLAYNF